MEGRGTHWNHHWSGTFCRGQGNTMSATEGLGLHHILMFLSFQDAQDSCLNLMRRSQHNNNKYNKMYFQRKWEDKWNIFLCQISQTCWFSRDLICRYQNQNHYNPQNTQSLQCSLEPLLKWNLAQNLRNLHFSFYVQDLKYCSLVTFNNPTSQSPMKKTNELFSAEWTGTCGTFVFPAPISSAPILRTHKEALYCCPRHLPPTCPLHLTKMHFQQLVTAILALPPTPTPRIKGAM